MVTIHPLSTPQHFTASCNTTDDVGHLVRISGPTVGSSYSVTRVDITDPQKMPAIGIIISKPSPSMCVVQRLGTVDVSLAGVSSLVPGRLCFVGPDAMPSATLPSPAPGAYVMIQAVGIGTGPSTFELDPSSSMVRIRL